jgi:hypothetical protein
VTAYVTAAAVFGPSGFTSTGLGPPGLVSDSLLTSALTLRGLRPLSRTARLAMVAAAAVWPPSPDARDAVVLGSARSSVAPLAEFVQVAAEHGADQVFPMAFPNTVVSVHVGYVATLLGITGPAVAVCGEHAGLEAVVEALSLLAAGRADCALALGADAAEPTVRSGDPHAAEGAAAVRLSALREHDCLAAVTGSWTAATYDDLPAEVRPAYPLVADRFGAASGAARVAAAALAVASDGRTRTVVGPSGVRGVAAVRLEEGSGLSPVVPA